LNLTCDTGQKETLDKQLLIHISEILAEQGLLSEEEKNRVKVMVNNSNKHGLPKRKNGNSFLLGGEQNEGCNI